MDALKGNINSILNGNKQFTIPVYQRPYSWGIEQCKKLWKDIVDMQKFNRTGHFVGSIVNIAEQAMPTGVQKFMIIDGQQRMTTLTLILIALRDYGYLNEENKSINPKRINGMCILNEYESGEDRYKMLLTKKDKEELKKLIDRIPIEEIKNSKIIDNYNYFMKKIKSGELPLEKIYEGIGKLQIVNITLDREQDDPQLIFESLNSTGMDLSKSDLIRNYILMGLNKEEQDRIYNSYWYPMEEMFEYSRQTFLMDRFFKHYLTFKCGKIPVENKIYDDFKDYIEEKTFYKIEELSKDLYVCAKFYTDICYANSKDKEVNRVFKDIKALNMDVASPFFIKVYQDFNRGKINKDEFIQILRLCESYVFRRAICEIPTNSLNKTFNMIIKNIDEKNYLNSVKAFLVMQENYKRFPKDEEFSRELKIRDIYNMRIKNYILSKLENYDNKAEINIDRYTIEHIMPQNLNLNETWKKDLGDNYKEIQKKYIHTLGNLTLTAYNSEMSDKEFKEKLNITGGFKESALRINSDVISEDVWNEDSIKKRANKLSEKSLIVWEYPDIESEELKKFIHKPEENIYTIDSYNTFSEQSKSLFDELDRRILNRFTDSKKEFKKLYIAYKLDTNFVDVVPLKSKLTLYINMRFTEIIDTYNICIDVTGKGRWGNGDAEIAFEKIEEIDKIMDIIEQSYEKQLNER